MTSEKQLQGRGFPEERHAGLRCAFDRHFRPTARPAVPRRAVRARQARPQDRPVRCQPAAPVRRRSCPPGWSGAGARAGQPTKHLEKASHQATNPSDTPASLHFGTCRRDRPVHFGTTSYPTEERLRDANALPHLSAKRHPLRLSSENSAVILR